MAAKKSSRSSSRSGTAANRARFARSVKNPRSKLGKKARDKSSNGSPGGGRKKKR